MDTRVSREAREVGKASTTGAKGGKVRYTDTAITADTTHQMTVNDFVVEILSHATLNSVIYLPRVSAARGKFYAIKFHTDAGANPTIECYGGIRDAYNWSTLTLATGSAGYLLFSDGESWWNIATVFPA